MATSCGQTRAVSVGGGDRVCIYLPGTNFNAASSRVVLGVLASTCRVYAADLPGQPGLSASVRPDDELSGYAGWVSDVIAWVRSRHAGSRMVLAGHSRGAAVALSADPDSVDGLALFSPAGLTAVRPTAHMLWSTVPWLVRRTDSASRRLLDYMSGPGHVPAADLVEWMTVVARSARTSGAPGPLPDAELIRWSGHRVRVVVGDHDVFFHVDRLRQPCQTKLGVDPFVAGGAGHLLVDEQPELVADMVSGLFEGHH